ncbi:MAG: hypothetical protein HZB26_09875 [Candidatus Hydrogenedentes bacterium]|nr:hypothetical protein [Candidatus Hydrogenedentota bacterium]
MTTCRQKRNQGTALIAVIVYLVIVTSLTTTFFATVHRTMSQARTVERRNQCIYLAEAGIEKAVAELRVNAAGYRGEQDTPLGDGAFSVVVTPENRPGAYRILATGRLIRGATVAGERKLAANVVLAGPRIAELHWMEASQ